MIQIRHMGRSIIVTARIHLTVLFHAMETSNAARSVVGNFHENRKTYSLENYIHKQGTFDYISGHRTTKNKCRVTTHMSVDVK